MHLAPKSWRPCPCRAPLRARGAKIGAKEIQQGREDFWNAQRYAKDASFVFESVGSLVEMLDAKAGERVLDLGCGSGELSVEVGRSGCEVIAVDSSPAMVEKALEKGLDARVMDGHELDFHEEFDAVFSNAALHWMQDDPRHITQNIVQSLRPGGRFVAEFGGKGNVNSIMTALTTVFKAHGKDTADYNPWYFPSKEEYIALVESEGMDVHEATIFARDTPCPMGPVGWLEVFGEAFFVNITPQEKHQFCLEVESAMQPLKTNAEGIFLADYVRLRIFAQKPRAV